MRRARRILVGVGIAIGVLGAVLLVARASIRPSNDRDWMVGFERLPEVTFDGDVVTIDGVRDYRWRSLDDVDVAYDIRTYDLSTVESLWYCLSVFNPDGWQGPAHSLLSFGFTDGRYLAISVEARKEVGESYSVWKGMARRFELMYVIGDERDLVLNRAVLRPDQVYLYPIEAPPDAIRAILRDMLEGAARIPEHPEFYDTIFNNCTTRLRKHVNAAIPGTIPASVKVQLPGYSDELLTSLGLIEGDLTVEEARRRYDIKEVARAARDDRSFSRALRARLGGDGGVRSPARGD